MATMESLIKIEGMTTKHNTKRVSNSILSLKGITRAEVSLEGGEAQVLHKYCITLIK